VPEPPETVDLKQRLASSWPSDSPYDDDWRLPKSERAELVEQLGQLRATATEWTEDALWVPPELDAEIREVVGRLVRGDYGWLTETGRLDPSTVEGCRWELDGYPATFVPLPDEAFLVADFWLWEGDDPVGLVEMPLWSEEEGPSDMQARLLVRQSGRVELYAVLVP
jgi:hypothetical protein